ncbi:hypothetical protein, partial [Sodalis sp.]|uniref:hypothetical protein n=1 Tax=Sodalis sp. (in: enterobacteria) TaxID=1898979 RepID=UPI0038732EE8
LRESAAFMAAHLFIQQRRNLRKPPTPQRSWRLAGRGVLFRRFYVCIQTRFSRVIRVSVTSHHQDFYVAFPFPIAPQSGSDTEFVVLNLSG